MLIVNSPQDQHVGSPLIDADCKMLIVDPSPDDKMSIRPGSTQNGGRTFDHASVTLDSLIV